MLASSCWSPRLTHPYCQPAAGSPPAFAGPAAGSPAPSWQVAQGRPDPARVGFPEAPVQPEGLAAAAAAAGVPALSAASPRLASQSRRPAAAQPSWQRHHARVAAGRPPPAIMGQLFSAPGLLRCEAVLKTQDLPSEEFLHRE